MIVHLEPVHTQAITFTPAPPHVKVRQSQLAMTVTAYSRQCDQTELLLYAYGKLNTRKVRTCDSITVQCHVCGGGRGYGQPVNSVSKAMKSHRSMSSRICGSTAEKSAGRRETVQVTGTH